MQNTRSVSLVVVCHPSVISGRPFRKQFFRDLSSIVVWRIIPVPSCLFVTCPCQPCAFVGMPSAILGAVFFPVSLVGDLGHSLTISHLHDHHHLAPLTWFGRPRSSGFQFSRRVWLVADVFEIVPPQQGGGRRLCGQSGVFAYGRMNSYHVPTSVA